MIRKNYIIDIRPEEQAAAIIDLKLKVVVEVTIEDNIVKITSGVTDDINNVLPPTISLDYEPKEEKCFNNNNKNNSRRKKYGNSQNTISR